MCLVQNYILNPVLVLVGGIGLRQQLTAVKGILVLGASVVCNLNATTALTGILKQVDVGAFVEAMMSWPYFLSTVKIVNITEARQFTRVSDRDSSVTVRNFLQSGDILLSILGSHVRGAELSALRRLGSQNKSEVMSRRKCAARASVVKMQCRDAQGCAVSDEFPQSCHRREKHRSAENLQSGRHLIYVQPCGSTLPALASTWALKCILEGSSRPMRTA